MPIPWNLYSFNMRHFHKYFIDSISTDSWLPLPRLCAKPLQHQYKKCRKKCKKKKKNQSDKYAITSLRASDRAQCNRRNWTDCIPRVGLGLLTGWLCALPLCCSLVTCSTELRFFSFVPTSLGLSLIRPRFHRGTDQGGGECDVRQDWM